MPPAADSAASDEAAPDAEDTSLAETLTIAAPVHLELVLVPAGEFLMGSNPAWDQHTQSDEQPQHWLELPAFYIGRTPVTNAQYEPFVGETQRRPPRHWRRLLRPYQVPTGKEDHPVVHVTWEDAVAYCEWLGTKTGRPFHLPTEAEWEKAARGSNGYIYPWGSTPPSEELCNYLFDVKGTSPVGAYSPRGDSPYGCADMAGNVWEWTASLYQAYPYDPTDGREDPTAEGHRVSRGGAAFADSAHVRAAVRGRNGPQRNFNDWGFRVALSVG